MKKEDFLMNVENKINFIKMLRDTLTANIIRSLQSNSDADTLIVLTAMNTCKEIRTVVIGEDTDLLILLIHYCNSIKMVHHELYFKSQQINKSHKIRNIKEVVQKLGYDLCLSLIHI